jgi:nickel/cobalt exporter
MKRLLLLLAFLLSTVFLATPASASTSVGHPLGNFSVNRYDGLVVAPGELRVDHVEDLAEIPTAQAGRINADARCAEAARAMSGTASGRPLTFTVRSAAVRTRPGQAGLPTTRVECAISASADGAITFRDDPASGTIGWHEITAQGDRMTLTASDVPAASPSKRLTSYPADLLSSPLSRNTANLKVRAGGPPLTPSDSETPVLKLLPRGADRAFADLIGHRHLTLGFAMTAFLLSVGLGALHALAPGHGKTIMATYAVSRGPRVRRDILTLGATITVTHTAGVLVLGLLILSGTVLAPGLVFGALGVASGLLVVVAGALLLRRAMTTLRTGAKPHTHTHTHAHPHTHTSHDDGKRRSRGAALMGFAGGLVPSPSAVLVLVGAAAIGKAWFGVALVIAYGIGLALALILMGLLVLGTGRALADRLPSSMSRLRRAKARTLPVMTSSAVILLGLGLVLRSLPTALG